MISRAVEVGCLAIRPRRIATATAMAECEIMRLEKAAVTRLASEQPAWLFFRGYSSCNPP
jgi:CRP-like cAMP-binding protein